MPECVYESIMSPHGFPHCVELFCSNYFLRQQGVDFFENPMKYICREIQNFKENDKIKYCLLLLILFNENKLEERFLQEICLSDPPKEVIKIFKAAGLSSDHAQSELKKALTSLKNTYVYETLDNTYTFSHESIRENVAFMYIKDNPLHAIEEIDLECLVAHSRCHGQNANGQESIFVLPSFCTNALVERMLKEIKNGHSFLVCQHQAWSDQVFLGKMIDYMLLQSNDVAELLSIRNILFTKNNRIEDLDSTIVEGAAIVEYTFLETLILYGHEKAVLEILKNAEIRKQITVNETKQLLSHAVIYACFGACLFLPSEDLILNLIHLGADINITIRREYIDLYMQSASFIMYSIRTMFDLFSPLLFAVAKEDESLVKLFLDNGGHCFIAGEPAVLIAAVHLNLPNILKILLEKQATSGIANINTATKYKTFYIADTIQASLAILNSRFIRFLQNLNSNCFLSLIHIANDKQVLRVLLDRGARVNQDVLMLGTRIPHCIFRAIFGLELYSWKVLLEADMDVTKTWQGKPFLHYLMQNPNPFEDRESLIPSLSLFQIEACHVQNTVKSQYRELLSELISKGHNHLNQTESDGRCALHHLLQDKTPLIADRNPYLAPEYKYSAMFRLLAFEELIRQGSDVNLQDKSGMSPVMCALQKCTDMNILLPCIKNRTPKLLDLHGRGYFHYLAASTLPEDHLSIVVRTLLESGENIIQPDKSGNVPVFECGLSSLNVYCNFGAALDAVNNSGQNTVAYVLTKGVDENSYAIFENIKHFIPNLNKTDESGQTLMHHLMESKTSFFGFKMIYDFLLSTGLSPTEADKNGVTPLMLAAQNSSLDEVYVASLFEQGFDLSARDLSGMSMLHYLLKSKRNDSSKLLLLRALVSHTPGLFKIDFDVLTSVCNETNCGTSIVQELLKHRVISHPGDDLRLIMGFLMSRRTTKEKVRFLTFLENQDKIRLPFRNILLCKSLSKDLKAHAIILFIKDMAATKGNLIFNKKEILTVIRGGTDLSVLSLLQQIERFSSQAEEILSDILIFTVLCEQNFCETLMYLLTLDIQLNYQDTSGNTIVHKMVDCISDDKYLVELLEMVINKNIELSQPNKNMMTPLHVACSKAPLKPESAFILIENTIASTINQQDCKRTTPLQLLCSNKDKMTQSRIHGFNVQLYLAYCLISKGADVDHQNTEGQTVIMTAAYNNPNNDCLLKLLIENSKNVNIQDKSGNTVLHYIARSSVVDEVKASLIERLISKGGDLTVANKNGRTCNNVLELLIIHKSIGIHVMSLFDTLGTENDILEVLSSGLTLTLDERGETLVKMKHVIIKRLKDVNRMHNMYGSTLLMTACKTLLPDATKMLLSLKASPNVRDTLGCTSLTSLLSSKQVHYMSVLFICYTGGDLYKEFELHTRNFFWDDRNTSEFLQVVADAETRYSVGNSDCLKIMNHINDKALDILHAILSNGADANLPDISGKCPLHHYVQSPMADIFILPAIQMLIDFGADVNTKDKEGMTPLMACSLFPGRKSRRLNILIAAGANIREKDHFGCDAVEYGKMAFGIMRKIQQK